LIWGYLVRDELRATSPVRRPARAENPEPVESALLPPDPALTAARERAGREEPDDELAAYNAYLARLHAADSRRRRS
jgi:hypothetical protein